MAEFDELRITVNLIDNASAEFAKLNANVKQLHSGGNPQQMEQYNRALTEAKEKGESLTKNAEALGEAIGKYIPLGVAKAVGVIGTVGYVVYTQLNKLREFAAEMSNWGTLAKQTGFGVAELRAMSEHMQRSGISAEGAARDLAGLSEAMADLGKANSQIRDRLFHRLGAPDIPAMESLLGDLGAVLDNPVAFTNRVRMALDDVYRNTLEKTGSRARAAKARRDLAEIFGVEHLADVRGQFQEVTEEERKRQEQLLKNSQAYDEVMTRIGQSWQKIKDAVASIALDENGIIVKGAKLLALIFEGMAKSIETIEDFLRSKKTPEEAAQEQRLREYLQQNYTRPGGTGMGPNWWKQPGTSVPSVPPPTTPQQQTPQPAWPPSPYAPSTKTPSLQGQPGGPAGAFNDDLSEGVFAREARGTSLEGRKNEIVSEAHKANVPASFFALEMLGAARVQDRIRRLDRPDLEQIDPRAAKRFKEEPTLFGLAYPGRDKPAIYYRPGSGEVATSVTHELGHVGRMAIQQRYTAKTASGGTDIFKTYAARAFPEMPGTGFSKKIYDANEREENLQRYRDLMTTKQLFEQGTISEAEYNKTMASTLAWIDPDRHDPRWRDIEANEAARHLAIQNEAAREMLASGEYQPPANMLPSDVTMRKSMDRSALDRPMGRAVQPIEGDGMLSAIVKAPQGTSVKVEGEGIFNKTETDRQITEPAHE